MSLPLAARLILALFLQGGPYDPDPRHSWNELHRAMFTWHPLAADQAEEVEADPRFWPLPKKPWDKWTVSKDLSESIDRFNAKLIQDPLKRAMLQHDLWMFLDGLEGLPMGNTRSYAMEGDEDRSALRRKLVPILRRLALSPEEIRALPDNYALAVKAKAFTSTFDPMNPERPFLPPDLWEPEGPWVLVGREADAVLAEEHVKLMRGRSVFFIFIALPKGRAATLEFVDGLKSIHHAQAVPSPPSGTRVVLLRRALLLDATGTPHLSPLTEEIRMRVSLPTPQPPAGIFEFHLVRSKLFGGTAGGLHAAGPDEQATLPFFNLIATERVVVRTSCVACHGAGADLTNGIRFAGFDRTTSAKLLDGVALRAITPEREAELTVRRQREDAGWKLIRPFWPTD